jgi:hypothetical protein
MKRIGMGCWQKNYDSNIFAEQKNSHLKADEMPKLLCTTIYDLAHSKREDLFPKWKEGTDLVTVAQAFWEAAYLFVFDPHFYFCQPHKNKQVAGDKDVLMKTKVSISSAKSTPPVKSVQKRNESVTKKTANEMPSQWKRKGQEGDNVSGSTKNDGGKKRKGRKQQGSKNG